jgi:hypothetical protein
MEWLIPRDSAPNPLAMFLVALMKIDLSALSAQGERQKCEQKRPPELVASVESNSTKRLCDPGVL